MSQLAAIQPLGCQFVQRGNPADFRLGTKLCSGCESFSRGDAGRERCKSCAQESAPTDAPRRYWIVRHLSSRAAFQSWIIVAHIMIYKSKKMIAIDNIHHLL
jgi:hypothetical protein